jgi:CDP-diacylglycerol---glycerol-3-phosphate 3-phosphatidyltransferase
MHELARILLLWGIGLFLVSLGFMAVARPALPDRVAQYGLVIRVLGRWMYWSSAPVVRWLDAAGFTADHVTWLGFLLTAVTAVLAGQGWWALAGLALTLGALCDIMDGELARRQNAQRASGAFLDSSLDRLSEMVLFGGMAAGFTTRSGAYWAYAAAAASMMVSYARARGEGLGVACPGGGLERPHRVLIVMFTLLFCAFFPERWAATAAEIACAVVAVGASATAASRMNAVYGLLRRREHPGAPTPSPSARAEKPAPSEAR